MNFDAPVVSDQKPSDSELFDFMQGPSVVEENKQVDNSEVIMGEIA